VRNASPMEERVSLESRLAGHLPPPSGPLRREAFARPVEGGLRQRILAQVDRAVEIFEVDRLLYDIEVDAQQRWLRRMMAFDAYCARREAAPESRRRPDPPPVR
jgi:hypothetical protein